MNPDAVGASWSDPAKAYSFWSLSRINFGWTSRNGWSSTVTQYYTAFEAGGIFLSGPGYLLVVFQSKLGIALGFLLLGLMSEALFRRLRVVSIWTVLLAYFLLRFSFGGDAFDAFHVAWASARCARRMGDRRGDERPVAQPGSPTAPAPGGGY